MKVKMIDTIIASLYVAIGIMFSINFSDLYEKFKQGNKRVSAYSLLATISLIIMFFGLALYFWLKISEIILISQIYMLGTMLFIKYRN